MQAVFFISLFSLIFLMFSSMTAGLSKNVMQANIERTRETHARFEQIKTAVTQIALKQGNNVDLSNADLTNLSGTFLPAHTSYTASQLSNDPWKKRVYLLKATQREAIWGASGGQVAEAPITTFLLISGGFNGRYDIAQNLVGSNNPASITADQIRTADITDESIVGDDIVIRFNNYEAMLDIWYKVEDIDNIITNVSLDYYKSRVDAFSPLIQVAQRDSGGLLGSDIFAFDNATGDGFEQVGTEFNTYGAFDSIGNNSTSFTNEWNDPTSLLATSFRTAKKYENEFNLDAESLDAFEDSYTASRQFLFPSFDAVEKNSSGSSLPVGDRGFQNLGIPNLSSSDPFSGQSGGFVEYEYNFDPDPHKIKLIRSKTPANANEWRIDKEYEIDGLGG